MSSRQFVVVVFPYDVLFALGANNAGFAFFHFFVCVQTLAGAIDREAIYAAEFCILVLRRLIRTLLVSAKSAEGQLAMVPPRGIVSGVASRAPKSLILESQHRSYRIAMIAH